MNFFRPDIIKIWPVGQILALFRDWESDYKIYIEMQTHTYIHDSQNS